MLESVDRLADLPHRQKMKDVTREHSWHDQCLWLSERSFLWLQLGRARGQGCAPVCPRLWL